MNQFDMLSQLENATDLSKLVGSDIQVDQPSSQEQNDCAILTKWVEITPLELKLTIEDHMTMPGQKIDYDKENECCLCFCALYDNLQTMTMEDVAKLQRDIIIKKVNKLAAIDVVRMSKCEGMHFFHKECLENQLKSSSSNGNQFMKCAVCGVLYGKQVGEMPNGTMTWRSIPFIQLPLQGYTSQTSPQVIEILYVIKSDTLPNGTRYHGTQRAAYLPGNQEGIKILSMLAEAFRRRLTFKVGTSITTGQSNVVVWQGIHHKTSPSGGTSSFGYPDPTYFNRVTEELAGRGVTEDQIEKMEDPRKGSIVLK